HPCSATLGVALKVISIEEINLGAVFIKNIKYTHIRLVDRQVVALFKADAEQFIHGIKDAVFKYAVELKVGTYFGLIDIVLRLTHLFSIIVPVPRFYFAFNTVFFHHFLNGCLLLFGIFDDRRNKIRQHIQGILRRLGGLRIQFIGRIIGITQQLSLFCAQFYELQDDWLVVNATVLPDTTIGRGFPDAFTQIPIV